MGIIEMFHDVHQIRLNSDESLVELKNQGLQLGILIAQGEETNNKLAVIVTQGAETNQKLTALIAIGLKILEVLGAEKPPEDKVVGISVTPGPVTERPEVNPLSPPKPGPPHPQPKHSG